MKLSVLLFCCLSLVLTVQATVLGDLEDDLVKLEEWLKKETAKMEEQVGHALEEAQAQVRGAASKLEDMVTSQVDQAQYQLEGLDKECYHSAFVSFTRVRHSFIMKIINCPYIQDALDDLGGMVYASAQLLEGIASSLTDSLKGLASCFHAGLSTPMCFLEESKKATGRMFDDIVLVAHFVTSVLDYAKNATVTVYSCATREELTAAIQTVLAQAQSCQESKQSH